MARRPRYGSFGTVGPARGFTWSEVRCTDGTLPRGVRMRRRFRRQARLLNRLRNRIARKYGIPATNVSIIVNSWYRSPNYNARIGGARYSEHVEGRATDVQIYVRLRNGRRVKLAPSYVGKLAARYVPAFQRGGIGVYTRSGFTHLDHRGYTARWSG